ncbi:MAG: hypothetical protein DI554_17660 [Sphingobium sp.]|nr:MAG: hypothetical protein DI554_17660 [Sphingobium sp.]
MSADGREIPQGNTGQVELGAGCRPGTHSRRNGSTRDPAYLVQTDKGDLVLKLGSELSAA